MQLRKGSLKKNSGADHLLGINRLNDQLPVVLLAPLVEYWTGIAEVKGSNPEQAWIFSGVVFPTAKVVHIIDECYKHGNTPISVSSPFPIITFSTLLFCRVLVSPLSKALSSLAVRKNKLIKSKDNKKLVDYPQLSDCTWMCINNIIKEHLSQTIFLSQKYRFSIFFNFPLTRLRDSCSTRTPISRQYRPTKKWPQKQ